MKRKPFSPPSVDDLADNEDAVQIVEPLDDLGRAQFTVFWIGHDHFSEGAVRGQVFHASVADFVRRQEKAGRKVTALDEFTHITLDGLGLHGEKDA